MLVHDKTVSMILIVVLTSLLAYAARTVFRCLAIAWSVLEIPGPPPESFWLGEYPAWMVWESTQAMFRESPPTLEEICWRNRFTVARRIWDCRQV